MGFQAEVEEACFTDHFAQELADEVDFLGLVMAGGFLDDLDDGGDDLLLLHPVLEEDLVDFGLD